MQFKKMLVTGLLSIGMTFALAGGRPAADIVDTAVNSKQFPTLVAAVKAAGLVEVLKGEGPFTVFAPTEAAFKALPKGTLESLLKPENKEKLVAILKYHVVSGKYLAADVAKLKNGSKVDTVLGKPISVRKGHGIHINNAKVVKTDILSSNGVIHVIDRVLLPK